jgi:hypothetical protein
MTAKRRKRILKLAAGSVAGCMLFPLPSPASAGFFDNFLSGGGPGNRAAGFVQSIPFFGQPRSRSRAQARPAQVAQADYSHAPSPAKADKNATPDVRNIVVMGDSMADWLAYGLEQAFADSPEISVTRNARPLSTLIYNPGRHDPAAKIDWPAAARDILEKEPASFVVMTIGLADRDPIHVPASPRSAPKPGAESEISEPTNTGQAHAPSISKPVKPPENRGVAETATDQGATDPRSPSVSYDFKTEKWAELYGKRIDETIAGLKSRGALVFWVGLPPLLGARSTADMQYLNDLFRSHAEKAGITYVDVWDGFSDDAGQFTMQGPDYEGQIRRLRTPDGIYFTPAGARKFAHFVEREIRRALTPTGPIAVPLPQEPLLKAPVASRSPSGGTPRPLAGPVIPLNPNVEPSKSDGLLGGTTPKQTIVDAVANRVLVNGDSMPAPAGRADDFTWPRRAPAPVGADPTDAATNLPLTPMVASDSAQQIDVVSVNRAVRSASAPARTVWAHARVAQARAVRKQPRPTHHYQYAQRQYSRYRQQSSFFFFFGH